MFKIFRVSIANLEFGPSQTVDIFLSLSTPLFSLSLTLPSLLCARAQALKRAPRALAAPLPCRSLPGHEHPARTPAADLPLPRLVEPAVFRSDDEHATNDRSSTTRRDAAVAPNKPGHATAEPLTAAGHQCRAPPAPKPPPSSPLVRFKRPEPPVRTMAAAPP